MNGIRSEDEAYDKRRKLPADAEQNPLPARQPGPVLSLADWPADGPHFLAKTEAALLTAGVSEDSVSKFTLRAAGAKTFDVLIAGCLKALEAFYEVTDAARFLPKQNLLEDTGLKETLDVPGGLGTLHQTEALKAQAKAAKVKKPKAAKPAKRGERTARG
jgi:hypothetical protein